MLLPVGVLAVLSAIGGLLSIPGVWHPFTHWVEETGEPLVEATAAPGLPGQRDLGGARDRRTPPRAPRVPHDASS